MLNYRRGGFRVVFLPLVVSDALPTPVGAVVTLLLLVFVVLLLLIEVPSLVELWRYLPSSLLAALADRLLRLVIRLFLRDPFWAGNESVTTAPCG